MYNKLTNRVRALKSTSGLLPGNTYHVNDVGGREVDVGGEGSTFK